LKESIRFIYTVVLLGSLTSEIRWWAAITKSSSHSRLVTTPAALYHHSCVTFIKTSIATHALFSSLSTNTEKKTKAVDEYAHQVEDTNLENIKIAEKNKVPISKTIQGHRKVKIAELKKTKEPKNQRTKEAKHQTLKKATVDEAEVVEKVGETETGDESLFDGVAGVPGQVQSRSHVRVFETGFEEMMD
ncbi:hypothetical protein V491_08971, partial [Pseudogymnoascus sp. VKM F-3775]